MSKPEKQRLNRGFPDADRALRFFASHRRLNMRRMVVNHFHTSAFDAGDEVSTDGSRQFLQADRTVVGVPAPLDFED